MKLTNVILIKNKYGFNASNCEFHLESIVFEPYIGESSVRKSLYHCESSETREEYEILSGNISKVGSVLKDVYPIIFNIQI